jgi:hypothetical protein
MHVFENDEERRDYERSFRLEEDRREFEAKYGAPVGPFSEPEDLPGIESTTRFMGRGKA